MAIDFTRYDLPAAEPHALQREWSLMNVLNQKGHAAAGQADAAAEIAAGRSASDSDAISRIEEVDLSRIGS